MVIVAPERRIERIRPWFPRRPGCPGRKLWAPPEASWAHVQSVGAFTASTGTTRAVTYGSNVTAGNLLIATCIWIGATATTCALTDTAGNTWTGIAGSLGVRGNGRCQVFYAPAGSSASNTVTMTTSANVSERVIIIGEFSGLSGSLGSSPTNNNGSSTNPSTNMTVDAASSLLIGACFSNSTADAGSGWTALGGANQDGNSGEYRTPAGTGSQAVSFTQPVSAVWAIGAAEFLASAGGGGGTTVKQLAALGVG